MNLRLPIAGVARHLPLAPVARAVDRAARPHYAVWELTLRCDLACHHCSSRAGRARPDELSTERALALVVELRDLGIEEVTLIGGEAYLRSDWLDIVRAVRASGMRCTSTASPRPTTDCVVSPARSMRRFARSTKRGERGSRSPRTRRSAA